ncbi:hypothetical protein NECID01_1956 [Nematocida sp. AWRm77]|nr:hypothetical protein NECID01_1956 [Nematocida sp. AWRm77]
MAKIVIVQNIFLLVWACAVLVCGSSFESLDFELTDICADINLDVLDVFYSDHSDILDSLLRDDVQNDDSSAWQSVLQEEQALESPCALDPPGPSNAVNTVGGNEDSSASASAYLSLPNTNTSSNSNSSTGSSIFSVQVQPLVGSAKRACDRVEKEDQEQKMAKVQKTKTTATATEANTALMDEAEVCMAVEKFNRFFGDDTNISGYMPQGMLRFAEDLTQRGLASTHFSKIVELCTASEQWLGHDVFWRMLMFFVDTMPLEVATSNRLEDKKTVVLRNRTSKNPLSECARQHISNTIAKCRGAERIEIQSSLSFLESRGAADVPTILKWLLHHVKIECVGISCDLTEAGMSSAVLGRQVEALSKEWRGNSVHIDSLALYFRVAQYMTAAEILKESLWVTVLKMHFIDAILCQDDTRNQALKALLVHCPTLEQLSVFGPNIGIDHIQTIAAMLPQLVLLEVEFLTLNKLELSQKNVKEAIPVFPGLKILKLVQTYNYSDAGMEKFMRLFSSLENVQISAIDVASPLIDVLSTMRLLRSLEIVNGSLPIETTEYLLEKLPSLECLSVGVKDLDCKLAHALSKCTRMHTLKLRGKYTPGFLASLLQPSPLMSTLKVLSVCRNAGPSYRKSNFSAEDKHSKKTAMKKFGCAVEIKH